MTAEPPPGERAGKESGDAAVLAWLRERGAEGIPHAGGSLYQHLGRVHDRLAAHGHSHDECLAGLAHAAYGTDGFRIALLDVADRRELQDLIGPAAEAMVFRYGGCDRDRTWPALAATGEIHNRFTGGVERPDPDGLRAFADLCVVNELDVCEHSPEIAARAGDYFRDIFGSWHAILSPAVRSDCRRVLSF